MGSPSGLIARGLLSAALLAGVGARGQSAPFATLLHLNQTRTISSATATNEGLGGLASFCRDSGGNLFAAGFFKGVWSAGNQNLTNDTPTVKLLVQRVGADGLPLWVKTSDRPLTPGAMEPHPAGGFALFAYFQGPATNQIGGSSLACTSAWGGLILEFAVDGSLRRSIQIEADAQEGAKPDETPFSVDGLRYDPQGNLFLAGNFQNALRLPGATLTNTSSAYGLGAADFFVAKLAGGTTAWARQGGGVGIHPVNHLAVAGDGGVVLTTQFGGTNRFGTNTWTAPQFDGDAVLLKLGADGVAQWGLQASMVVTGYSRSLGGVVPDGQGGWYVEGQRSRDSSVTNGVEPYVNDAFVARVSGQGAVQWSREMLSTNAGLQLALAPGASNGVVFAAQVQVGDAGDAPVDLMGQQTITVPGAVLSTTGGGIVGQLGADGALQWARSLGGLPEDVVSDALGNVFVSGSYGGERSFAGITLKARGNEESFLVKVRPSGETAWALPVGGLGFQLGAQLAADGTGGVYVSGLSAGLGFVGNLTMIGEDLVQSFIVHGEDGASTTQPVLALQPNGARRAAAQDWLVQVSVLGAGPMAYKWFKDGAEISDATNSFLLLKNITRAQTGAYVVAVSNATGGLLSSNAVLRLLVPQRIDPLEKLGGGSFKLRFGDHDGFALGDADKDGFVIQWSTNFTNWFDLTNVTRSVVGGKVEMEDSGAPGQPRRFYRVLER